MKKKNHYLKLMLVCGIVLINAITITTAIANGEGGNDYSPNSQRCYQTLGYCPSGMNYKCVLHKTAVYCYQSECSECETSPKI